MGIFHCFYIFLRLNVVGDQIVPDLNQSECFTITGVLTCTISELQANNKNLGIIAAVWWLTRSNWQSKKTSVLQDLHRKRTSQTQMCFTSHNSFKLGPRGLKAPAESMKTLCSSLPTVLHVNWV